MQDRLTIDRPATLGTALAEAVRSVCDRRLSLAVDDLALLDARLVCGDFESVQDLLRSAAPSPALPLFVARYLCWSGDLHAAAAVWRHVTASLEPAFTEQLDPSLRRTSLAAIAPTATDLGEATLAARILGLARQIDAAEGSTGASLRKDPGRDVQLVSDVALNTLGIDPDAARGRLRLRPRLDEMDELAARNIRFADGSVSIHAVRERDMLTIRVEQDAGSIPITLLLEPFVRGTGPATATVDGQSADLVARTVGADPRHPAQEKLPHDGPDARAAGPDVPPPRTIIPVQLVLDEVRTLVINEAGEQREDEKKGPVT